MVLLLACFKYKTKMHGIKVKILFSRSERYCYVSAKAWGKHTKELHWLTMLKPGTL
jgi:hypothetical protein